MVDLLAPGSPLVSLKDASATTALARLLHYQVRRDTDAAPAATLRSGLSTAHSLDTSEQAWGRRPVQVESYEDIYEVLRQGRMTRAAVFTAAAGSPGAGGRGAAGAGRGSATPLTGPAHVMLNIQLTGFAASGEQLATNLTFVELAAPEAKVRGAWALQDWGLGSAGLGGRAGVSSRRLCRWGCSRRQ